MIPILYKLDPNTPLKQAIVYLIALLVVAYAAFAGWRGAPGATNPKTRAVDAPTTHQKLNRASIFAAVGAALALAGLYYILPVSAFLGRKGEGIPIHTYGRPSASGRARKACGNEIKFSICPFGSSSRRSSARDCCSSS